MFGRDWKPGRATIVAARASNAPTLTHNTLYPSGRRTEYVVDVQPDGREPMFRATLLSPMDIERFRKPTIGDVVPVLCDAKRQKVKFDTEDPSLRQDLANKAKSDAFEEASQAVPGSPAPDSFAARLAELGQLGQQQAGDPEALRQAAQRMFPDATVLGSGGTGGADAESVEQRLAKLQKLRDDGVLTAEEFAAQRQRIIEAL
jgi:hypothetical protein